MLLELKILSFFSMLLEKQSCEKCSLLTHASSQCWFECDYSCEPASSFPSYLGSHWSLPGVCAYYLCSVCLLSLISLCSFMGESFSSISVWCRLPESRADVLRRGCFSHTCLQVDRCSQTGEPGFLSTSCAACWLSRVLEESARSQNPQKGLPVERWVQFSPNNEQIQSLLWQPFKRTVHHKMCDFSSQSKLV